MAEPGWSVCPPIMYWEAESGVNVELANVSSLSVGLANRGVGERISVLIPATCNAVPSGASENSVPETVTA